MAVIDDAANDKADTNIAGIDMADIDMDGLDMDGIDMTAQWQGCIGKAASRQYHGGY